MAPTETGLDILRANLRRIEIEIPDLETKVQAWSERPSISAGLDDARDTHKQGIGPLIEKLRTQSFGPILIEGITPPWILQSLLNAPAPESSPGFQQRIIVLQHSWDEFFDGLSMIDLTDSIGSDRIEWFVGLDAGDRLMEWFEQRISDAPPAFAIQNPLLREKATPRDAMQLLQQMTDRFKQHQSSLIQTLQSKPPHDLAWWLNRFRSPADTSDPLRVLIPVSRYTTYLRHIASDLREAYRSMSIDCRVVFERDNSTKMSSSTLLSELIAFDPHLIVSINYTRSMLGDHIPTHIPHVCWIQDTMNHLYSTEVGARLNDRDFIVGMVKPELISRFGYPESRTKWLPMGAARAKFADSDIVTEFDAEIVWATHQSEAPSVMKQNLLDALKQESPGSVDRIAGLLDDVERSILSISSERVYHMLEQLLDTSLFPQGIPDAAHEARSHILHTMVIPYAERVFRHQTAEWAAEIAQSRGWRFRLYGNGWETHPTLSEYAAGPLDHGAEIRQVYNRAAVHLHASINQVLHQRVTECLLSGGLPLCRVTHQSYFDSYKLLAEQANPLPASETAYPADHPNSPWFVSVDQCPLAAAYVSSMVRFGFAAPSRFKDNRITWQKRRLDQYRALMNDPAARTHASLFSSMYDQYFTTRDTLEDLLDEIISSPKARAERIRAARSAIPEIMTTEGFASSLISLVRDELAAQASP